MGNEGLEPIFVGRREDGAFFMFYSALWWDIDKGATLTKDRAHHFFHGIGYTTSNDGVHWEKPKLGLVESPAETDWQKHWPYPTPKGTTRDNNLGVPFAFIWDLGQFGNVSDPSKRYALRLTSVQSDSAWFGSFWRDASHGYFASEIPDFFNDPKWQDKLKDSGGGFSPRFHLLQFWDDLHKEWVAMTQGVVPHWLPSREVGRFASKDLVNWTSQVALSPDTADPHTLQCYDEPMYLTPFCAEGVVFGMLSWFHSDRSHPHGGPGGAYGWPWVRKGTNETRITISRDGGRTWNRAVSRTAWIPHGTEEDSYDRLVIGVPAGGALPPLRVGDEDYFYFTVINGDHLITRNSPEQDSYYHDRLPIHQVALYIQKHNRYVSLTAHNQQEVLITKPIAVTGSSLQLNVDATRGEVRVGIASAEPVPTFNSSTPSMAPHLLENRLLPGFTFEDCIPISVNSIEYSVAWKSNASLDPLRDRAICLLFQMVDADLYGFRIVQ